MNPVRVFGQAKPGSAKRPLDADETADQVAFRPDGHQLRARILGAKSAALLSAAAILANVPTTPLEAQALPPTVSSLVSVCSGVSLPPSTVTGIMSPVITGITGAIEANTNQTLGALSNPLLGIVGLPAPLSTNATGLLATAASGSPITLQVLSANGTLVGPSNQCDAAADSYTLDTAAGVAIGGNQITGLGNPGQQAVAGEIDSIAIGNNATTAASATGSIAIGTGASVGSSAVGSLALGNGATATAANSVALGAGSTAGRANSVSIGAAGAERQLVNVAAGTQATDAVNLGQLNAVAATIPTDAVQYDDSTHATVTLSGASGTRITNVQAGTVSSTSTDAVNGAQLSGVQNQVTSLQTQVTTNTTDIGNLQTQVGGNTTAITNLQTQVGGNTTAITNLQTQVGGNTTAITNLQTQVGGNTTAITNLQTQVGGNTTAITNLQAGMTSNTTAVTNLTLAVQNGAVGPVQYSNPATPTAPNGGTPTNSVTLVGAAVGAVAVHNVANGTVASGSTDAVNGGQLFTALSNIPVAANAVTYDSTARTAVTLNSAGGPVVMHNMAAGTAATDAANVGQLNTGMASTLASANSYTDARLSALNFDLARVDREARAGTAAALAASGMPQASGEGRTMISGGVGTYRGRVGVAFGASHRAQDGRSVYKIGLTYDSSSHVGANAGAGIEF